MKTVLETKLYNVKEIKELLGLSELTIRRYIKDGKIKSKKIGREIYVNETDLKEFVNN